MKYLFLAFTAAALLVACNPKTAEIIEVTETTEETATSTEGDMPKADIGEGKVVFLTKCTGCHKSDYINGPVNALGLDDYSKERIEAILPKMLNNAELNEEQSRQVSAYLFWEIEN